MAENLQEFSLETLIYDLRSTLNQSPLAKKELPINLDSATVPPTYSDWAEQVIKGDFDWSIRFCTPVERYGAIYQQMRGDYPRNSALEAERKKTFKEYAQASTKPKGWQPILGTFYLPGLDSLPEIKFDARNFDPSVFKENNLLQTALAHALGIFSPPLDWADFLSTEGRDVFIEDLAENAKMYSLPTRFRDITADVIFFSTSTGSPLSSSLILANATSRMRINIPRQALLADYGRMVVAELEKANNTGVSAHQE